MITAPEIRASFKNALPVMQFKPGSVNAFARDRRAVLQSFWVIVLLLPIQLGSQTQEILQFRGDQAGLTEQIIGLLCYFCSWLLFPVVLYRLLAAQGKGERIHAYLPVHNWTVALYMAFAYLLSLVALIGIPSSIAGPILFAVGVYGLMLRWYILRETLEIGGGRAALYTFYDLLLLGLLFIPYADALGIPAMIAEQSAALQPVGATQ